MNANFETSDLAGLWRRLRESLATAGLLEGTIVTCEGERGWVFEEEEKTITEGLRVDTEGLRWSFPGVVTPAWRMVPEPFASFDQRPPRCRRHERP